MTRKRMVGPGGGDFALDISTAGGRLGGGRIKPRKRPQKERRKKPRKDKTAKPESSMKSKKKTTRTKDQLERLRLKAQRRERDKHNMIPTSNATIGGVMGSVKGGLNTDIRNFQRHMSRQDSKVEGNVRGLQNLRALRQTKRLERTSKKRKQEVLRGGFTDPSRKDSISGADALGNKGPPKKSIDQKAARGFKKEVKEKFKKEEAKRKRKRN